MAYSGSAVNLIVGQGGLLTDISPGLIPASNLINAGNVLIRDGIVEKAPGSLRWNADPLPSPIVALYDWWPNTGKQYTIAVTKEGRVYRFQDQYTVVEITPTTNDAFITMSGKAPDTLSVTERVHITSGGQEFIGVNGTTQPRKLFIFTGNNPIQVIDGEEIERHNILKPAQDWTGTYPYFGLVFVDRLFVFGNRNKPHSVYGSSNQWGGDPTFEYGQEDFTGNVFNTSLFNVFPGLGERNQTFFQYKSKLALIKYPRGLFTLEIPDIGDATTWYFQKINEDVGTPTITGAAAMLDDVYVINTQGSIQSLSATLNLGGIEMANVLRNMNIESYVNSVTSPLGFGERQAFWHEQNKTAYFVYRGRTTQNNHVLLVIDFSQNKPIASIYDKDQPNVLTLRRDVNQVERVIYGSDDGYIYEMDRQNRWIGAGDCGEEYDGIFQTPHMMLGVPGPTGAQMGQSNDKNFDFIEIEYIPTGPFKLFCDVYIDGRKTQTVQFRLDKTNQLNSFVLDLSRLQGRSTRRQRKPIQGRGRSVSARFYNAEFGQNFKITGVTMYFRGNGVDEKGFAPGDGASNQGE